ncbi:MAG: hypothetical protein ABSF92_11540 [Candidatus Acidiferrales bacterium]|jgi:hypothetical protein
MATETWSRLERLAIVPCHAVWNMSGDPFSDKSWYLQPFQSGEPPFYVEHIRSALCSADPKELVVFSGGQTNAAAGPRAEAQGYWLIAERLQLWASKDVRSRSTTEDFARDSYENLLYSICRFWECTSRYPTRIRVYGWKFKRSRFTDCHRAAIRFPLEMFEYIGVNDPSDLEAAQCGEKQALAQWAEDAHGVGFLLSDKRRRRNPFRRYHPYTTSCRGLAKLLAWDGSSFPTDPLPWAT